MKNNNELDGKNENLSSEEKNLENLTETTQEAKNAAEVEKNAGEITDPEQKNVEEVLDKPEIKFVETNPEYRPETSNLGNDEDGTPKISAHAVLNTLGKNLIRVFAEREGTNLPKLTGTEIKNMCRDQNIDLPRFQYSDSKSLRGRIVLVADGSILELPTDINEEFNFGVDFDAMGEAAIAAGKEWGEKQLQEAKAEAELDQKEKNRLSIKNLEMIASEITAAFEERAKTNLPALIEKDILDLCRNHLKGVGISAHFENAERTLGRFKLTEFLNTVIVPAQDLPAFTFGIDYQAAHYAIVAESRK